MSGRVAVVLGTRPEIIKCAGVIRRLGARGYLVHTGQHYDAALSDVFFDGYGLPRPEIVLSGVGGQSRSAQFVAIFGQLAEAFATERPAAVVVQGDTNSAAAGAQVAHFLDIPVVHVEAGLRSFDLDMPEEINRKLIGVVADLHCAPTPTSRDNLLAEGVLPDRIAVTGNTVVEATIEMLPPAVERRELLARVGLIDNGYVVATIHRPENTDQPHRLGAVLSALGGIGIPVVVPLHPRTQARIEQFRLLSLLAPLQVIDPVDHPTFLALAANARLLVSDSGGVQEECTVIKRPLVVLRNSTERPEAVDAGFARRFVPGERLGAELVAAAGDRAWHNSLARTPSPYGDGTASEQIVRAINAMLARVDTGALLTAG